MSRDTLLEEIKKLVGTTSAVSFVTATEELTASTPETITAAANQSWILIVPVSGRFVWAESEGQIDTTNGQVVTKSSPLFLSTSADVALEPLTGTHTVWYAQGQSS